MNTDLARSFKTPGGRTGFGNTCPRCWTVLDKDGTCFWCQHGCSNGCGPISHFDGYCVMCSKVTFRCPGDGCASPVHRGEGA